MLSDRPQFLQNTKFPLADQAGGGNIRNPPIGSFFGRNVDFQPSRICPRNFIIFDRTENRSQIMYHPGMVPNLGYPCAGYAETDVMVRNDENASREARSFMKEDSADIDLLLSFEDEDEDDEEDEDEEISTARTHGNDASDTADSCCSKARKRKVGGSVTSHKTSERKREKMRKMVNSLRGMVPGGNGMNTVTVIDEAVKYLKSLKVELLQNASGGNLKN